VSDALIKGDKDPYYRGGPFDREDPRSLINIMPREAIWCLEKLPVAYLYMSEKELRAEVNPDVRLNQIRIAFWKEYDMARSSLTAMSVVGMQSFLDGLPSIHVRDALQDPEKLAWILCPPASYDNMLEEALARGLGRINEIIDLPLYNNSGEVDERIATLILKAVAFLDIRKHGMPTQKIDSTTRQLNVNITKRDMKQLGSHTRIEDLDAKIKKLESELGPNMTVIEQDQDDSN
jgi:hypothetical protein